MSAARVLYVDDAGEAHPARIVDPVTFANVPTRILVKLGPRLIVVEAPYSSSREPGTWSMVAEPVS
jgi:hypothetical protein